MSALLNTLNTNSEIRISVGMESSLGLEAGIGLWFVSELEIEQKREFDSNVECQRKSAMRKTGVGRGENWRG